MALSNWQKKIMDGDLPDRLEYAATHACNPECKGRCLVCPAEVMREAATALRNASPQEDAP